MKQNRVPKIEYSGKEPSNQRANPYRHDVIYSNLGQWKYPGQVTKIPSGDITMQGVHYPVYGEDNLGHSQMMYPGMNYTFPGDTVTEYPMALYGGDPNRTVMTGHYQDGGGWLDSSNLPYAQDGISATPTYQGGKEQNVFYTNNAGKKIVAKAKAAAEADRQYNFGKALLNSVSFVPHPVIGTAANLMAGSLDMTEGDNVPGALQWAEAALRNDPKIQALKGFNNLMTGKDLYNFGTNSTPEYNNYLPYYTNEQKREMFKPQSLTTKKNGGWLDKMQTGGTRFGDLRPTTDASRVFIPNLPKQQLTKAEKEEAKKYETLGIARDLKKAQEKVAKINRVNAANKAQETQGFPTTRQEWADQTQALGDKLSLQNLPVVGEYIPDMLDVTGGIGNMGSALASAPLRSQQENSYMPYLTGIGSPLLAGALGSIGAKNTRQFVNNVVNPFAGLKIDKLPGYKTATNVGEYLTTQTPLKNTYKLNPWAFKSNPNAYYRGIGKSGLDDALKLGVLRSKDPKAFHSPYFTKAGDFKIAQHFNPDIIVEAKGKKLTDDLSQLNADDLIFARSNMGNVPIKHSAVPNLDPYKNLEGDVFSTGLENISLNNPNIKLLKKDWLRGYKSLNSPKIKNINEPLDFVHKGIVEKNQGINDLKREWLNYKQNKAIESENSFLSGKWENQNKDFINEHPLTSESPNGFIEKPIDSDYLNKFKNSTKQKKGGSVKGLSKFTSKNIQSSINDIMIRNETLFGHAGKRRYKPGLKYKSGGGWLDNLH